MCHGIFFYFFFILCAIFFWVTHFYLVCCLNTEFVVLLSDEHNHKIFCSCNDNTGLQNKTYFIHQK
jgi:hypothetical protein